MEHDVCPLQQRIQRHLIINGGVGDGMSAKVC